MIIYDFYIVSITILPNEADTPLAINADAMLTLAISTQLF